MGAVPWVYCSCVQAGSAGTVVLSKHNCSASEICYMGSSIGPQAPLPGVGKAECSCVPACHGMLHCVSQQGSRAVAILELLVPAGRSCFVQAACSFPRSCGVFFS